MRARARARMLSVRVCGWRWWLQCVHCVHACMRACVRGEARSAAHLAAVVHRLVIEEHEGVEARLHLANRRTLRPQHEADRVLGHVGRHCVLTLLEALEVGPDLSTISLLWVFKVGVGVRVTRGEW